MVVANCGFLNNGLATTLFLDFEVHKKLCQTDTKNGLNKQGSAFGARL
jgi:hypothetical protein